MHLPISKIRYDFGLHVPCAIARKILHWFRSYIDTHDNNEDICMCFEMLWGDTFCSSQFKNGEVCSRIDGSHVNFFIINSNRLAHLINTAHRSKSCVNNFTQLPQLLLYLFKFWTNVTIDSRQSYLKKIDAHELNMDLFCKHGNNTIFTNTHIGDGETFYLHCAKHHVSRISRIALNMLGCGVVIWTMQGFEHRNK